MILTEKDKARFWSKVDRKGPTECWEWTAAKHKFGHGVFNLQGLMQKAHRISAHIAGMEIKGLFVCHHCDNPSCVNPNHLFAGSNVDNTTDRHLKGRSAKGQRIGKSKLDTQTVQAIRRLYASGKWTQIQLADQFGIEQSGISNIINRKAWAHV